MTRQPTRVLYLLPAEGFGGAERQGLYHLGELPRHGIDVHGLFGPGDPALRALGGSGASYERFDHFPDRTHTPLSALGNARFFAHWLARVARSAREVERHVRASRYDLIFANRTVAWLVAARVAKTLGVPYVIRAGSRFSSASVVHLLPLLDHLARPAAVFSNCRAVDAVIGSRFHARRYLLPNAVDTRTFAPGSSRAARAALGLPPDAPLVGLAARPSPEKGFDMLARVIARVRARCPTVCFVMAGEFGWRARYESHFRTLGFGDAVRFLGHVDGTAGFFRAVDLAILTSRARSIEGSPNALLEAMAVGRPVVATAVGGVPELVTDGREGFLIREDDDRTFAHRIAEFLGSPDLRERLGNAGRARAVSRHELGTVVETLARDLRAVAARSKSRMGRSFAIAPETNLLTRTV